ncbi:hypothetical protein ACFSC4_22170 [Deinococcus malanensis]|uniref:hypothetical protein n=1 Tax=Deinococcus malanensis TaxID=1706855 RepID=UPI0036260802
MRQVTPDEVHIDPTRVQVAAAPVYDPELVLEQEPEAWEPAYTHFGYMPYWSSGYIYPGFPVY